MTSRLRDLLTDRGQHLPDATAYSLPTDDGGRQVVGWGRLLTDINGQLARADTPRAGELVFIAAGTEHRAIVAYLACLFSGAVPAFLAPLTARQDTAVHARELQALVDRFQPNLLVQDGVARRLHHGAPRLGLPPGAQGGFVQFSSGTTSLRKAVWISESRLQAQLAALGAALQVGPADRIASWLPLYHDMGLIATLFLPLVRGIPVHYLDAVAWSYRPDALLTLVAQEQATLCWQPDFAFRHLVNCYRRLPQSVLPDLSSLRALVSCSEPCRADSMAEFLALFGPAGLRADALRTSYAMAETVFAITQSCGGALPQTQGILSSGTPVDGCALRIARAGPDGIGEIEVRSPMLFDHYLQQPGPVRPDGWHPTGDLGCLRDGHLVVLGRTDDTLVVHGKKIIAHQIEDHLGRQPGFKAGRVFCTRNAEGSALCVYYEGDDLPEATRQALRRWVASSSAVTLDGLHRVAAGTLVKSSSGKIARTKTLAKLQDAALAAATAA